MNEKTAEQSKSPQPKAAKSRALDETDAVRVTKLSFYESVDVPGEQGVRSLPTNARSGKPLYEIVWLPRVNKYLVRSFDQRPNKANLLMHTFLIDGSRALAELEVEAP